MTPKGLSVDGVRYLNSDGDVAITNKSGKWEIAQDIVDQPERCSEGIKIEHKPVFWTIATAVVAGLALFLVRNC